MKLMAKQLLILPLATTMADYYYYLLTSAGKAVMMSR